MKGDLVLVRNFQNEKHKGKKFEPRWTGPQVAVDDILEMYMQRSRCFVFRAFKYKLGFLSHAVRMHGDYSHIINNKFLWNYNKSEKYALKYLLGA